MIAYILGLAGVCALLAYRLYELRERVTELEAKARHAETDINVIGRYVFEGPQGPFTVTGGGFISGGFGATVPDTGGVIIVSEGGTPDEK